MPIQLFHFNVILEIDQERGHKKMTFRPSAVPLVTVDPYFSIWSFADQLSDDVTRHWTGQRHAMLGLIRIDGKPYRFMGQAEMSNLRYAAEPDILVQTGLEVEALSTNYRFENESIELRLRFMTPLLLDDLSLLSRPASYIRYEIISKDGQEHETAIYFEFSSEIAVDQIDQSLSFTAGEGRASFGHVEQKLLHQSGDDKRIDWGYFHLVHPGAKLSSPESRWQFIKQLEMKEVAERSGEAAHIGSGIYTISDEKEGLLVLAYDDIKSIEYFGEHLDAYYKLKYGDFETALAAAVADYDEVETRVKRFEAEIREETFKVSAEYADITALAYRQAIAAHKLVHKDGVPLFFSKECYSNGCIATMDITYPSMPLFLRYNPEFIKGMLRPIFHYAGTDAWPFDFCPHDTGQYPLSNGQVYGENKLEYQMPVEESGNALIAVAAIAQYEGSSAFLDEHRPLLDQWANYLLENGYDPGNQLCTDDFAGHLAHNVNLSMKAIIALAAYGKASGQAVYSDAAATMAKQWVTDATAADGSRTLLAFDKPESWSLKYNMIWDRLLGLGLFDDSVYAREVEQYQVRMRPYGVPLDSRSDYTKIDWEAWTTILDAKFVDGRFVAGDYTQALYQAVWRFISETRQRVPISDWYYSSSGDQVLFDHRYLGFQNRAVVGGLFVNMLLDY